MPILESRVQFKIAALRRAAVVGTILICSAPSMSLAQDFRAGRSAYNMGDYAAAVAHWRPLAEQGHADAQAALGYLYLNGLGVPQDDHAAAGWYMRAAEHQQPDALYFLGTLHLAGRGVRQDTVRAFVLCDMALSRGAAHSFRCRQEAVDAMSSEEMTAARARLAEWRAAERASKPSN